MVCFTFLIYLSVLDSFQVCNRNIFHCSKNITIIIVDADEKLKHAIVGLVRVVVKEIHKHITSSEVRSLTNIVIASL